MSIFNHQAFQNLNTVKSMVQVKDREEIFIAIVAQIKEAISISTFD